MEGFKENFENAIQKEHEIYVRKLEFENEDLKRKLDNLFVNLNIISRLTNDERTAAVITDIITMTRQNALTI